MNDQWNPKALFVRVIFMHIATMLAEALAVVSVKYEDRFVVKSQLFVLIEEVLQEVVLITEVVRPLEALRVHRFDRIILIITEVLCQIPKALEVLGRGLEENGTVALLLQEVCKTGHEHAARFRFGGPLNKVWFDPAVDGDARLEGIRDGCIGALGQEAVLRQFVQERRCPYILVVRGHALRTGRLQVDQDDLALLSLGRAYETSTRCWMFDGSVGSFGIRLIIPGPPRILNPRQDQVNERIPRERSTGTCRAG